MGILPCKRGCPLLHIWEQWAVEWAAQGDFAMQISLPTSSIYGNSGQPTTSNYEKSRQWSRLPMGFCRANEAAHYFHIRI